MSHSDIGSLERGIMALEAQRDQLGDEAIGICTAILRQRLHALLRPRSERRRHVTVMFADLSSFTTFAATRDPEDVTTTINLIWDRLDATILAHGGLIDKHIGDAVMAIWGSDIAQEDDPEKAVLAALAIQAELQSLGAILNIPLIGRVGINTGEVLLTTIGTTGEFTAIGDTVNIAARLEHAAPIGQILVSQRTQRHIAGRFEVTPQPMLQVKGRDDLIQTYLVVRALNDEPIGQSLAPAGGAPLIGREAELEQLCQHLDRALSEQCCQHAMLIGEAGVGKSRLLLEFANRLSSWPQPMLRLRIRALRQYQQISYRLIRDIIGQWFQIGDHDQPELAQTHLIDGMRRLVGDQAEVYAHTIGHLIGHEFRDSPYLTGIQNDPAQLAQFSARYLSKLLSALTAQQPLVLLLDDLHFADQRSLDLLSSLLRRCANLPILLVSCTRPAVRDELANWTVEDIQRTDITLAPLNASDSANLIAALLDGPEDLPEELQTLIISNADGNPYYIEELLKMLVEDGALQQRQGIWQTAEGAPQLHVPATLTAVLQARLDRLSEAEQRVIECAAVVGRVFWAACVERLCASSAAILASLERRELIFQQESAAFAGQREYIFKHTLLRDVAYERVMRRQRPGYHRAVAEWLEATARQHARLAEHRPMIAEHYEAAGMRRVAIDWLQAAAMHALEQHVYREARSQLEHALTLIEPGEPGEAELQRLLGAACTGDYAHQRAAEAYRRCLVLSRASNANDSVADAQIGLGQIAHEQGQYQAAYEAYTDALRATDDLRRITAARHGLAEVAAASGDWAHCVREAEQGLHIAQASGDQATEAQLLATLGRAVFQSSDQHMLARAHLEQSRAISSAIGDLRGMLIALISLADLAEALGHNTEAHSFYDQCVELLRQSQDQRIHALVWQALGGMYLRQGDLPQASQTLERSLAAALTIDDPWRTAACLAALGDLARYQGDPALARDHYEHTRMISQPIGAARHTAAALRGLGMLAEGTQTVTSAQSSYQESLQVAAATGEREQKVRTHTALTLHYLRSDAPDLAASELREALADAATITGWATKAWLLCAAAQFALRIGLLPEAIAWGSAALLGATDPEVGAALELLHRAITPRCGTDWYMNTPLPRGSHDAILSGLCRTVLATLPPAPTLAFGTYE